VTHPTDMTSGSDSREPRPLDAPVLPFDLAHEIDLLYDEPGYGSFGRASKTLAKAPGFPLVLTVARAGATIGNEEAEAPIAIQVLGGSVTVGREVDAGAAGGGHGGLGG
jgi:hypothetical protein